MEQTRKALCLVAGANLKRLIKESDCRTQEEFAYQFGTDIRTVNRWVNQGVPNLTLVEMIADFFGVDPLALLS